MDMYIKSTAKLIIILCVNNHIQITQRELTLLNLPPPIRISGERDNERVHNIITSTADKSLILSI